MNKKQPPDISVIQPLTPAIEKVKMILFRPFELSRWFTIGFCAWLAYLGSSGANFNFSYRQHRYDLQPDQIFQQAKDFVLTNMAWLIPLALAGLLLAISLWLVFTWLSSRGRFMFLHCVALNKAEVKTPWHKFQQHARSLFLFRIVLDIINSVAAVLFCLPIILLIVIASGVGPGPGMAVVIIGMVLNAVIFVPVIIAFLLVRKFTEDFVVPIMFLRTTSCTAAWRRFLQILSARKGSFALYILFQIVIAMAVSLIVMAAACVTCCCAACILAIPYIGTVLMLPLLVFKRAYSLCYLRQFGPDFDLFAAETPSSDMPQPP